MKKPRLTQETIARILEMYTSGLGCPTIAKRLELNQSTISYNVEKAGVMRRSPIKNISKTKVGEAKKPLLIAMVDSGEYTLEQVGQRFNLTRERVRQIYKKATGKKTINHRHHIRIKKEITEGIKKRALKETENLLAFHCKYCKRSVSRGEARTKRGKISPIRNTCANCREIVLVGRVPNLTWTCEHCHLVFHPNRRYFGGVPKYRSGKREGQPFDHWPPRFHTCSLECRKALRRDYGRAIVG